jgi:hypothetical protein
MTFSVPYGILGYALIDFKPFAASQINLLQLNLKFALKHAKHFKLQV